MNILRSAAVSALLFASSIATATAEPPLPAGKPAGTHDAALAGGGLFVLLGVGAVIAVAVAIASSDTNKGINTPTTSTTGTGV